MFKIDGHFCYGRGYVYWGGGYDFLHSFGFVQGARLLGIGTIFWVKFHCKNTPLNTNLNTSIHLISVHSIKIASNV